MTSNTIKTRAIVSLHFALALGVAVIGVVAQAL